MYCIVLPDLFLHHFSENTMKTKGKITLWSILSGIMLVLAIGCIVGTFVAERYVSIINSFFNLDNYKIVGKTDPDTDTKYYKSAFLDENGELDEVACDEFVTNISRRTAEEGAVLLWNHDNALPIEAESSVSLFGKSSVVPNYVVDGSGNVKVKDMQDLKSAFSDEGFSVNKQLYAKYEAKNPLMSWSTSVGECSWSSIFTSEENIATYGDNAIFILCRRGCENADLSQTGSDGLNGNILDLTTQEVEILNNLVSLKNKGVVKKLIVLISSSHTLQFSELSKYESNIDACMWVGMGGKMLNSAMVNLLSGKVNPSGRLANVYVYDNFSNPANANMSSNYYTNAATDYSDLYNMDKKAEHQKKTTYLVYQEGIYVGYRYYETRYEDSVLGNGNATSPKGAKASVDGWNYTDEVKYPFGYGISYTTFAYSDYKVTRNGDNYNVTLTVTNTGDVEGREVVQVYLQKPYTDYDKANGIEKASVELVGFAKTAMLGAGESQKVTIPVAAESFKTYDANKAKTYILEKGDYYIAVGYNSHDALNNILADKGKTTADGMDYNGDSSFVYTAKVDRDDFVKYSETAYGKVTNAFEQSDCNKYVGNTANKTLYLSRNDWDQTYPQGVTDFTMNDTMYAELQWNRDFEEDPDATMPLYEQDNGMKLIEMRGLSYDNEFWDKILDQMSFEDQARLVAVASGSTQPVTSVGVPGTMDIDGPAGMTKFYTGTSYAHDMCYPCESLMASTFDVELIEQVGECFGEDLLMAGYQVLYGPGANIQRSPYSGRNGEYYSEDPYLSAVMLAVESRGIMSRGIIPLFKHFALNDQEVNRHCVNVWANEQSIREIYLACFEKAIVEEKCPGVMASFNSIGTQWASAHKGLLTQVLRGEWGFQGYVSTDGADEVWMSYVDGLLAGNNLWMHSGDYKSFSKWKNSPTFCQALRESCHGIMYALANSSAVNGLTSDMEIVPVTNWWQHAIIALDVTFSVATAACVAMLVVTIVQAKKRSATVTVVTTEE